MAVQMLVHTVCFGSTLSSPVRDLGCGICFPIIKIKAKLVCFLLALQACRALVLYLLVMHLWHGQPGMLHYVGSDLVKGTKHCSHASSPLFVLLAPCGLCRA